MGFLIHSGAEHDPIGLEGLSHFVEHVVSNNTSVSKEAMAGFFEDCGGMVDLGTTGYPYTHYRFFVPTDTVILARAFSMFGHMLLSAKLEDFIERERQVIIGEFNRHYPVKFEFDLDARERKAVYAGYWLERFVRPLGNPESIARITQSNLQSHYDTHYTPANMSIVGVGGMQLPQLVELLSESPFAASKMGTRTPLPTPETDLTPPSEMRHIFEVSRHITMPLEVGGYRSVTKIPGDINGCVTGIMKEMLNKVLFEEVRERRAWAYAVNASQCNFRRFYEFSINCSALALKALDTIEEVIETCIASMTDHENLFEQTKRSALASNLMIDRTAKNVCDDTLDDLSKYQRIISQKEIADDLKRVTMDDIRNTLRWLRPEQRWTLVTRP
jgi:predicted Zn-dependent peptidase